MRWIIDPLDSTANFATGHPDYAVSIAATDPDRTIAAVIYRPTDDLYLATATDGLAGSAVPGLAPPKTGIDQLDITISRPHDPVNLEEAMRIRAHLVVQVQSETRIRSAACALLRVATGTLDSHISVSLPEWDTAAGHHLVRVAGGLVRTVKSAAVSGSATTVSQLASALTTTSTPSPVRTY